jgi:hypothetical protein
VVLFAREDVIADGEIVGVAVDELEREHGDFKSYPDHCHAERRETIREADPNGVEASLSACTDAGLRFLFEDETAPRGNPGQLNGASREVQVEILRLRRCFASRTSDCDSE